MLSKLFDIIAVLAVATLLAAGGFVGFLFGTGKLNAARVDTLARVLRGELDPVSRSRAGTPTPPVPAEATAQPLPATPGARSEPRPAGSGQTEEEIRHLRQRQHLAALQSERAARDLEAQRRLLEQVLQDVISEQERLAAERQALDKDRTDANAAASAAKKKPADADADAGFQKELALVSGMQPRQAKEHILRVWKKQPADAARLLRDMDESKVKRIFEQFKTLEELQTQSDLLEQIRELGTEGYAKSSGKTGAAATP